MKKETKTIKRCTDKQQFVHQEARAYAEAAINAYLEASQSGAPTRLIQSIRKAS